MRESNDHAGRKGGPAWRCGSGSPSAAGEPITLGVVSTLCRETVIIARPEHGGIALRIRTRARMTAGAETTELPDETTAGTGAGAAAGSAAESAAAPPPGPPRPLTPRVSRRAWAEPH